MSRFDFHVEGALFSGGYSVIHSINYCRLQDLLYNMSRKHVEHQQADIRCAMLLHESPPYTASLPPINLLEKGKHLPTRYLQRSFELKIKVLRTGHAPLPLVIHNHTPSTVSLLPTGRSPSHISESPLQRPSPKNSAEDACRVYHFRCWIFFVRSDM